MTDPRYAYALEVRGQLVAELDAFLAAAVAQGEAAVAGGNRFARREWKRRRQMMERACDRTVRRFDAKLREATRNYDPETGVPKGIEEEFRAGLADILKE